MEYPHLNINGTSKDALETAYVECFEALNVAIHAVCLASPHGRDYPQPFSLATAVQEHAARISALCSIRDDLQLIVEHIGQQTSMHSGDRR
jgi:hypothetical protein